MSMANLREEVVLGNETEEVVFDKWVKHFFNHWLDILVEYRDAIINDQPIGASGKPKAMNKNAQEIKDYITQAENAFNHGRYGMEEALLLSDALKKADAKNLRIEQKYYRDSQDPTPSIDEVTKKLYKMILSLVNKSVNVSVINMCNIMTFLKSIRYSMTSCFVVKLEENYPKCTLQLIHTY